MSRSSFQPGPLHNHAGFAEPQLDALVDDLSLLAPIDAGLARAAVRWVADGEDASCLDALARLQGVRDVLYLVHVPVSATHPLLQASTPARSDLEELWRVRRIRGVLLHPETEPDPAAWVRLGKVWSALAASEPDADPCPIEDWPAWWWALYGEIQRSGEDRGRVARWPIQRVATAFAAAGEPPTKVLDLLTLETPGARYWRCESGRMPRTYGGWAAFLGDWAPELQRRLRDGSTEEKTRLLQQLHWEDADFHALVPTLAEVATCGLRTPATQACRALGDLRDEARPHLERLLVEGDPTTRQEAGRLLFRFFPKSSRTLLRASAADDGSSRVRQTFELLLAAPAVPEGSDPAADLPPVERPDGEQPPPAELARALRKRVEELDARLAERYDDELRKRAAEDEDRRRRGLAPFARSEPTLRRASQGDADAILDFLGAGGEPPDVSLYGLELSPEDLASPTVSLVHVLRLDWALDRFDGAGRARGRTTPELSMWDTRNVDAYRSTRTPPPELRDLAAAFEVCGLSAEMLGRRLLRDRWGYFGFLDAWEDDAIWPFFAERPELLDEALHPSDSSWDTDSLRTGALRMLALLPSLPASLVPAIWDTALGGKRGEGLLARAALRSLEGRTEAVALALGDGRQAVRQRAAEWLADLGDSAAIPALLQAFGNEKQDAVRGPILTALEALGAPLRDLLDPAALLAEARAGLKKKPPKGMEWVPLDEVPALHWNDGGAVEPEIVRWWIVRSIRLKDPAPGPLLRRYLARCRPDEAGALARWILRVWLDEDLRGLPRAEAEARVAKNVTPWTNWTNEEFERRVRAVMEEPAGSATSTKGMLALAAAAGDEDVAVRSERYIRTYYGTRLHQSKALLTVLAWVRDPTAVRILIALATRFRTAGIRTAAEEHLQALARREGWTVDQLEDRTVPDAGFVRAEGEDGRPVGTDATLELDYGGRMLTVRLDDRLRPVVTREDGKILKAAPPAAQGDDPELAAAARKRFGKAKSTVKKVVTEQTGRLGLALATQRTWRASDWRRDLADHPIVGRLVPRLVWSWEVGGDAGAEADSSAASVSGTFRPLEDGTLTDVDDQEVRLPDGATVRLAHGLLLAAETAQAWKDHLRDYDVELLVPQFDREPVVLDADSLDAEGALTAGLRGHVLGTYDLRRAANRRGWDRGPAGNRGICREYLKLYASLDLRAVLHTSGSILPEEDAPIAILGLTFERIGDDARPSSRGRPVPLEEVPPVLLVECAAEARAIAGSGDGFDPAWESRVEVW